MFSRKPNRQTKSKCTLSTLVKNRDVEGVILKGWILKYRLPPKMETFLTREGGGLGNKQKFGSQQGEKGHYKSSWKAKPGPPKTF